MIRAWNQHVDPFDPSVHSLRNRGTMSSSDFRFEIIIIIIVIILLDLHSFDTPHIPTVTFLTVLEVDSVDTYGWWKNNLLVNGPAFILHLRPIWVRSQRIRKNTSQRSLSHQSRLPASTNFLKVFCLYDTLAFEYPSHYLWDDPAGYTYSLESAVTRCCL